MPATILHVVELRAPNPWLNGIATYHDRARFRHVVVNLRERSDVAAALEERGLRTYALGATGRVSYPLAVARLTRLLRRERVDVVQTHLFEPSVVGLSAAFAARTPVRVVTRHYSDLTTVSGKRVHRWLDGRMANRADRVWAVSNAVVEAMVADEGVAVDHITVEHYGYEFDVLEPVLSVDEQRAAHEEMGGDDRTLVVTVGRLDPLKGHAYLLQAAPAIVAAHPNVQFVFVGEGPAQRELEEKAAQLGVADHVTFLGWRSDAWRLMEASDLVVHPSLSEAFCSVLIEAQALERPLVATDVGGAPEQADDRETAVLVPAADADALRDAVLDVLGRPAEAAAMGVEARRRVVERFSFPVQMARYEALYDELLSGRVTSPSRTPAEKWAPTAKR
jgi:glycosyltransferase involved in cell wall biosynthesis